MRPPNQADDGLGCDWAAYGLFQTLGKGRVVIAEDGSEVPVFDFAPGGAAEC
jgi:hypothetical protein